MDKNDGVCRKRPANTHGRSPCIPDQVEDKLDTGKAVVNISGDCGKDHSLKLLSISIIPYSFKVP